MVFAINLIFSHLKKFLFCQAKRINFNPEPREQPISAQENLFASLTAVLIQNYSQVAF